MHAITDHHEEKRQLIHNSFICFLYGLQHYDCHIGHTSRREMDRETQFDAIPCSCSLAFRLFLALSDKERSS